MPGPGVLISPTDRAEPGCARRGAWRPCRLPSATACGRRWCSTGPGPSAGVRIIDTSIQALGVEAHRVGHAQQDHPPVLERREAVLEVGRGDRNVLAQARRVVVVDPGVVARLGAGALEALEPRARVLVEREPFGTMVARRIRSVE